MNVSERYRQLVQEARHLLESRQAANEAGEGRELRLVVQAVQGLAELGERVGDVPRIRLEAELTPVLLKAHMQLDRARLILEEAGDAAAGAVWEMEQKIYRLLNEL